MPPTQVPLRLELASNEVTTPEAPPHAYVRAHASFKLGKAMHEPAGIQCVTADAGDGP